MESQPLFNVAFLAARWETEFQDFQKSDEAQQLLTRLQAWSSREVLNETASETAFIKQFFQEIWGYSLQGDNKDGTYQCHPQFPVSRAGQKGGIGKADLALGMFGEEGQAAKVPQVLCEFKDIRSGLDHSQNRKGNARSPVRQAFDYLREAHNDLTGHELVEPSWAIVTDMREFRLYNRVKGLSQYQVFSINEDSLLGEDDAAAFKRFLFFKLFAPECLLSKRGPSFLKRLIDDQLLEEGDIEKNFYLEYKAYREFVFKKIVEANPEFTGTKGKLVRLTQRFLDRCLFIMFCEDMGVALDYPPQLLRDVLIHYSTDAYYSENDSMPWDRLKTIFSAMRDGGVFGEHKINRFNGGLFEYMPDLANLKIPASVFCAKDQGAGGGKTLLAHPKTLLFLSAKYNFGIKNEEHQRMIDFYALGRIFEQSITELEIMEAEADGRESLNLLTKRKRDGVYYTPEWVTAYIVEETVGLRLREIKEELGLAPDKLPNASHVQEYRVYLNDKRKTAKVAGQWLDGLKNYRTVLNKFKVVDPACGSGAFLIQALEYLKKERKWIADEQMRISGVGELFDLDVVVKEILANNIYGVDINPESVEIAKLALWMHTATKGKPLSSLDHNIQCGNSLVGPDFYESRELDLFSEEDQERINVFDWKANFPEAFAQGGFDCVIGNPPYVKLQHFRKVQESIADYLLNAKRADGSPLYESTQTGNFDMYLPFIEKGIELLNENGKMGYIAPNVWMVNDYGEGLRKKLKQTHQLDRWIDFKSHQIFDEAMTYTALQFFSGQPQDFIRCVFAPNGQQDVLTVEWEDVLDIVSIHNLSDENGWHLSSQRETNLLISLASVNRKLGSVVDSISQGLISGAFWIFANEKIAGGKYIHSPKQKIIKKLPHEIEIEEDITLALATGDHIKRYQSIKSDLAIIFPYSKDGNATLYKASVMEEKFPKTWKFLKFYEAFLRKRDSGKLDDECWYRYSRNQNLDKQPLPKLMIAGTAQTVLCTVDERGDVAANDKRVYSIFASSLDDLWFLSGILNAPVVSFYFKRIARPKAGGFFDIESQFLKPLPIPNATPKQKANVAKKAKQLQELHTKRRDLLLSIDKRLDSEQCEDDKRDEGWIWADVRPVKEIKKDGPRELKGRELTAWAKGERERRLSHHLYGIDPLLRVGVQLSASAESGELNFMAAGAPIIEGIFLDEAEAAFIAAQWGHKARKINVTEKFNAKKLISFLLKLRKTDNPAIKKQVIKLNADILSLDTKIAKAEADMNTLTYKLYKLTDEEIRLVEEG